MDDFVKIIANAVKEAVQASAYVDSDEHGTKCELRFREIDLEAIVDNVMPECAMSESEARDWAWKQLKQDLDSKNWTAGESGNFHAFFLYGWNYKAQLERQRKSSAA